MTTSLIRTGCKPWLTTCDWQTFAFQRRSIFTWDTSSSDTTAVGAEDKELRRLCAFANAAASGDKRASWSSCLREIMVHTKAQRKNTKTQRKPQVLLCALVSSLCAFV